MDSQMWRAGLWLPKGIAGGGDRWIGSLGLAYTQCYIWGG